MTALLALDVSRPPLHLSTEERAVLQFTYRAQIRKAQEPFRPRRRRR